MSEENHQICHLAIVKGQNSHFAHMELESGRDTPKVWVQTCVLCCNILWLIAVYPLSGNSSQCCSRWMWSSVMLHDFREGNMCQSAFTRSNFCPAVLWTASFSDRIASFVFAGILSPLFYLVKSCTDSIPTMLVTVVSIDQKSRLFYPPQWNWSVMFQVNSESSWKIPSYCSAQHCGCIKDLCSQVCPMNPTLRKGKFTFLLDAEKCKACASKFNVGISGCRCDVCLEVICGRNSHWGAPRGVVWACEAKATR